MTLEPITHGVFFSPVNELPRGRHALERDAVEAVQRERLMTAFTELVAASGLAPVTVADVVARAGVSRSAFYLCFDDLSACADAGYERFISVLVSRLTEAMDPTAHWLQYVENAVRAYLEALQSDLVVARAFLIEMDAAGKPARMRRHLALQGIATLLANRHAQLRAGDPSIGPLPEEAHLGVVHAVRSLACDALDHEQHPDLVALVPPIVRVVAAMYKGAGLLEPDTSD